MLVWDLWLSGLCTGITVIDLNLIPHTLVLSHSFFLLPLVLVEHLQCNYELLFNFGEYMCMLDLIGCLQALMEAETNKRKMDTLDLALCFNSPSSTYLSVPSPVQQPHPLFKAWNLYRYVGYKMIFTHTQHTHTHTHTQ